MKRVIERLPQTAFFVSGLALTMTAVWGQTRWLTLANDWLGLGVSFNTRPAWFVIAMNIVVWLPWFATALVITLRITKGKQFKALAFTAGALSPVVMIVGLILFGSQIQNLLKQQSFDSSAWIAQEKQDPEWPARLTMIDDLMERQLLDSKSKEQVFAMLGAGETSGYWHNWDVHYWLGPERGVVRLDSEWLVIQFNKEGRVAKYAIVRD